MEPKVAVVTGASSGIGAASARALAEEGFEVVLGARRTDLLAQVVASIGPCARGAFLDVTSTESVAPFCQSIDRCHLLVNNAGGALGLDRIADAEEAHWLEMYESNVLGVLRMTKALLPALLASGDGHVITIGSIAAFEPYPGGAGYNAAKAGSQAVMDVLRLELNGQPLRVSEIDPAMTRTDFSLVRFDGDEARAAAVYEGMTPLRPEDVADCVAFVATRPPHVDIDRLVVRPRDQARIYLVHREHPEGAS